jgi:hypothetical protein
MLTGRHPLFGALIAAALWAASAAGQAADAPAASSCRDDMQKLCASVQPGGGRAVACLKQHAGELSAACRAALPVFEQCRQEVQALCGADGGPHELRACLRSNATKLSPECRAAGRGR